MIKRLLLLIATVTSPALQAYDFDARGTKWPGARTTIYTNIPGTSPSGVPWATAYANAANEWSAKTRFTFDLVPDFRDPCIGQGSTGGRPDYQNGADFRPSVCGRTLDDRTLAVTVFFTESNILGSADLVEADIIFNSNLRFDVYSGPLRPGVFDFYRIALHELGHVMGLGHEDNVPAIMNSNIGRLDSLQTDDIDGANALYAGLNNCDNRPLVPGWTFGELAEGDCRVNQLVSGGSDESFVDVYTLQVDTPMTVTLETRTSSLDSVLLLADNALWLRAVDENSAGNCQPRIRQFLQPGNYTVLVNTYSSGVPLCGETTTGDYRLSFAYESTELLPLRGVQSFAGGSAQAVFRGGITTDGGQTFRNRIAATEAFDVVGQIEIDPAHRGQPGFLMMAAILNNSEILVKRENGEFVEFDPERELITIAERRVLGEVEDVEILRQLVARNIGVETIEVQFLMGYGIDAEPDELYFHEQGINLIIE